MVLRRDPLDVAVHKKIVDTVTEAGAEVTVPFEALAVAVFTTDPAVISAGVVV